MTSTRRTSVLVGVLFLTQTVAFIIAENLISGVLDGPTSLTGVASHADALTVGALFAIVSGTAVVAIAVLLYPLLRPTSEPMALAYVCERVVELVVQILFFMVVPLLLIAIGQGLHDGTVAAAATASLGSLLTELQDVAIVVLYLVTSVGGIVFGVLLYRSRLVPRPLAVLALVGYPALLVGCVLDMFDVTDVTQGAGQIAIAPGGLFELLLPIWLLAKGFSSSGRRALPEPRPPVLDDALDPAPT